MNVSLPMIPDARRFPVPVRRRRDDYAFLPAALEILETPVSPIRGTMLFTVCGLMAAAVAIGTVGQIDIMASAQGKIQPVGRTKTVEPLEPGRVAHVAVENGQLVKAGDLLATLDTSEAEAERAELLAALQGLQGEVVRRRAALSAVGTGVEGPVDWGDLPDSIRDREARVLAGDRAQLVGQLASLDAKRVQATAEADRLRGTIAVQDALTAAAKQRLDMRSELFLRNAESKASVIDAEEAYDTQLGTLVAEKGQLGTSEATVLVAQRDYEQAKTAYIADNATRLAEAERRVDADRERLEKARIKVGAMTLRSPVDGRVSGLTVTTPGQVVRSGEQLMQIVPNDGRIEIEAYLPNGDVGFVKPGQSAVAKVQAFPFAEYGTVDAHVVRVGDDAIPLVEAEQREGDPAAAARVEAFGGAQRLQNLVFPVTIALDQASVPVDGVPRALTPGMAVTVEVRTGSRRMISYLLAPLVEIAGSAFRER